MDINDNKTDNNITDIHNLQKEYEEAMLNAKSDLERRELSNTYYYRKEKFELEEEYKNAANFAERQWITDKIRQLDKNYITEQNVIDKCKRQEAYDNAMSNAESDVERKKLSNNFINQEAIIELEEHLQNPSDPVQRQLIKELIIKYDSQSEDEKKPID